MTFYLDGEFEKKFGSVGLLGREDEDDEDDETIVEEEPGRDEETDENETIVEEEPGGDEETVANALSPKQTQALEWIKDGHNVFITGVAGTGKSLLLQHAMDYFRKIYGGKSKSYVAVAPTGTAAVNIGGQTIHSFARIGIPKTHDNFSLTRKKPNADVWKELEVMILDEASMVSGEFFDCLSDQVSIIRNDPRPFGGIQLVICADFLQLSPIQPRKSDVAEMSAAMEDKGEDPEDLFLNRGFCFQSHAWSAANFHVVQLDEVFRQKNNAYVKILQDIREGRVTRDVIQFLSQCERPLPENEFGIQPTRLYSRNVDVSRENLQELRKLKGEPFLFTSMDAVTPEKRSGPWIRKQLESNQFFKNCQAEKELELKLGAQVMLVKNLSDGSKLVNGSRGKVIGFRKLKTKDGVKDSALDDVIRKEVGLFWPDIVPLFYESRFDFSLSSCCCEK
jgi:ATP-dependent DNA helicase PIF1